MSSVEEAWYLIKQTVKECCCCITHDIEHKRFSGVQRSSTIQVPPASSGGIEFISYQDQTKPIFDAENHHVFLKSKPKFRLKWNFSYKYFKDSNAIDENSTDVDDLIDRESGYGRSIDEESLNAGLLITVTESHSRLTYKVGVEDQKKYWLIFRRQLEFIHLQESLKKKNRHIGPKICINRKASIQDLTTFLQNVANDTTAMQLQSVREFFILDRIRMSSSSSTNNSDNKSKSIDLPQLPAVLLSPKRLVDPPRPPPPIPPRKSAPKLESIPQGFEASGIPISKIPLGCEEKKMSPSDFEFLSLIGKGSFGKVMMARKKTCGKIYAVKMLNKRMILKRNETAHVMSERSVLTRVLKHPYVVQLHFAFTSTNKIYFVLDYVNGGELFYHLQNERTFSESRTRFYGAEICCALTYMHLMGIVYRDLKPENILLDREGHVVLTDFGLCKEGLEDASARTATFCGTPEYLAPEIILKLPYTRSIDWWTFGAVLYEMMYGLPPFYSKDTTAMYHAIIKRPVKLRTNISPVARDLLVQLLQKNPSRRLGSGPHDGCEVQAHDFFQTIDWDKIERREIKPQFVPKVQGDDDLSNIDPMFTKEAIVSTPSNSRRPSSIGDNNAFRGFSYVSPQNQNNVQVQR